MFSFKKNTADKMYSWLALFTLTNIFISAFIATRYYQDHSVPETPLGMLFGLTHNIGHLGLLFFIGAIPLYLLAKITNRKRIVITSAIIFACLEITILLADTFIYQQYRFHINAMVIELFIAGGSEVISFSLTMWLITLATCSGILLGEFLLAFLVSLYVERVKSINKKIMLLILLCLISSNVIHIWADGEFNRDVTKQSKLLPLAYPATAQSFLIKNNLLNVEANKTRALLKHSKSKSLLNYPKNEITYVQKDIKPNIIMIVIDSWRAEMMNKTTTPNIYQFATNSLQFTNHFSGSNNTRHGMFSLIYGIPGTYWDSMLKQQQGPVLIKTMLSQGYQAQVFASAKLAMPEFDQTLFVDIPKLRVVSKGETPWQRDDDLVKDYLSWHQQASTNQPKFSLLFFDAAHGFSLPKHLPKPFTPSLDEANYLLLDDDYFAEPLLNLYKNTLYDIDNKVGQVLTSLQGELDNTIVIITGDHGKEFNDNKQGYWGHNSNYSKYQTSVPLVIHWPTQPARKIDFQTSHLSIVPTIMSTALGVKNQTKDYSSSISLFNQKQALPWLFLGRTGYYAIKDEAHLYELDRLGNFTIFDKNYQAEKQTPMNVKYVQEALIEMSRFFQQE